MSENRYLSVKALTKYIKKKFEMDPYLKDVFVKGEISNFKRHSSGHMYFTLKDDKARIMSVMFSSSAASIKFQPENGMNVLVRGDISVFESSGQYQIYVKSMEPDGIGALYLAYEQLKEKLEKEGLFLQSRKRQIPSYPRTIGVITSPTGAAVRDIITTVRRRYPIGKTLIIPALVQGEKAAASIVDAIAKANEIGGIDVLIVGRGGGSIEELWSFNEEVVARAIYHSSIPVISAVGHETDFTIADFVADLRAPTPTGAAELAVPHIEEILDRVMNQQMRLIRSMRTRVESHRKALQRLQQSYVFRNPIKLYEQKMVQLDRLTERLQREKSIYFQAFEDKVNHLTMRMERNHPQRKLEQSVERHKGLDKWLQRNMAGILEKKNQTFAKSLTALEALNPLKIMDRGYSVAYTEDRQVVKSIGQLKAGQNLKVHLKDGQLQCTVDEIKEDSYNER
ncbi:exodeoxyribonuclease VII large subunit [Falsibacillus pallidus]|uniref:Exodeoxyribonuclease 7 large subunit n=1 Tax=Falsibacillus pallidus TaxID=493781 RepID=A0A370GBX1_9BACI|nr:exodeoxyribonuclease VII large subunit [Falsibacillus pallidus]RDI41197.1 exodeoxyribonuclease VII large subunit [Falsibacillus pallidus]